MVWLKIIGGVLVVLVIVAIVVALAFRNAVAQFNRPPLAGCNGAGPVSCDGVFEGANLSINYRLLRPENGAQPKALFVMLHGAGLNGPAQEWLSDGGLQNLATRENILVLLPSAGGENNNWLDWEHPDHPIVKKMTDQAPDLFALMDSLTAQNGIDRRNVAIAGYSNGGTMAMRLACEATVPFRAVGAFGSPITRYQIEKGCNNPTPAMLVHGTADSANRFDGGYPSLYGIEIREKGLAPALSSPRTVEFWRENNRCGEFSETRTIPENDTKDGTTTRVITYGQPTCAAPVVHVIIENGGHYIPGDRPFPFILRLMQGGKQPTGFSGYNLFWDFASRFLYTGEENE